MTVYMCKIDTTYIIKFEFHVQKTKKGEKHEESVEQVLEESNETYRESGKILNLWSGTIKIFAKNGFRKRNCKYKCGS